MSTPQTSEFPTWEWARVGAAASSISDAWLPFSERLSALGFEVSALIYEANADTTFPSRSELFGTLISAEYVEYCWKHTTDDFRFRVPAASMQGRQMLIEPERILGTHLDEQERSLVALMADFGLKCGWTTPKPDLRSGHYSFVALSASANLPVFHGLLQRHGAAIAQATIHLTEGLAVRGLARSVDRPILTRREADCLAWTSAGLSSREISERLRISINTVNEYLASAQHRLQAHNRTQAVARAMLLGVIVP